MNVSLNIVGTTSSWSGIPVVIDRGTTERELADMVQSDGGICRFDSYSERAVWGWGVTDKPVDPMYNYHISPTDKVAQVLKDLPNGAYINSGTFK